jgi:hypothetical protein
MHVEPLGSPEFSVSFSEYGVVGFHASSTYASPLIESAGFLPHKILRLEIHERLLSAAVELGMRAYAIASYQQWLEMRSVTFTRRPATAINHARSGFAVGQGLQHVRAVLAEASKRQHDPRLVDEVQRELDLIAEARPVVYAVDLSNLHKRLVPAEDSPDYLRVYFNPHEPLPSTSIVGPTRLIARLDL